MNLETYRTIKLERARAETETLSSLRSVCPDCRKSKTTCYCAQLRPFASGPEFVILIHPKEHRKRVGTGRLTHLCIRNSLLVEGVDFTNDPIVNRILADPSRWPVVLYPGANAVDLTSGASQKLERLVPEGKKLVIFVIDGSWFCAKKMLRLSRNLKDLPQIRFTPPTRSSYQIRRQPNAICFASVEAVHFVIEQLRDSNRWHGGQEHENLLEVFQFMVRKQLAHVAHSGQRAVRGKRAPNYCPKPTPVPPHQDGPHPSP